LQSRTWVRQSGRYTIDFEKAFASMLGVRQALTVCSGTAALNCAMHGFEIGPGDEVLVTPYTFHTGASIPLMNYALPIFVDIDAESLQMDPAAISERVGPNTRAMIVCHWGGQAADIDGIMAAARQHQLSVCEDAYQALFGTWHGRQLGAIGDIGVIGHHENEILTCGEGATLISDNEPLISLCYTWHDFGREWDPATHRLPHAPWAHIGRNMKVMDVHGAVLLANLERVQEWGRQRRMNAQRLKQLLASIPGITMQKEYAGQEKGGYSQLIFHYDRRHFNDLPREGFLRAMRAEGIPLGSFPARPVSREPYLEATLSSPRFQKLYSRAQLDRVRASFECPRADRACETAVNLQGRYLNATEADMTLIAESIRKVQKHSASLRERGAR
jgi:dTDP-4-amino-4,6-dideoxygalactose transaminase